MTLKEKIAEYAHKIGIDLIGFTDADALLDMQNILVERQNKGMSTPFTSNDAALRCDPKLSLADVKSIIAVGMSYNHQDSALVGISKDAHTSRVSRSARGIDYHLVLREKLERVIRYIEDELGRKFKYQIMVDTGPLVEREIAKKAGIGFYGYNCCIINQTYGSWIFLGEILTVLDFEPDPSCNVSCAACNICLKSCPTGALKSPYEIVADKCISYITQKGGFIPEEYRKIMGNRLFGCDNCQESCPHNSEIPLRNDQDFQIDYSRELSLLDVLEMTDAQFKEWFGNSAAGWRKKSILQRNAAIGLGNSRDKAVVPALACALLDKSTIVRGHSAWALGEIGGVKAVKALTERLKVETDREVKNEIKHALAKL